MRRAGLIALLLAHCSADAAAAEPAKTAELVIVVEPANATPAALRSLARIRDELAADKYRVTMADARTATATGTILEYAASEPDDGVLLALFGDPDSGQAELWVVARARRGLAVRRAAVSTEDPERMPALLSARALELVRATSLELSFGSETATETEPLPDVPVPPPRTAATRLDPPRAAADSSVEAAFDFDMGLALLSSVDGPGPAILPVGRLRWHFSGSFYGRVSVLGIGTHPRVDTSYGWATVSQSVGLIELGATFRRDTSLRPSVSVGAGALHVSVVGVGNPPYEGRDPARFSAALDGGLGMAFALTRAMALATEVHALVAIPHPTLYFVATDEVTIGFPSFLLTAAVQFAP
jgi:hypothetical protein